MEKVSVIVPVYNMESRLKRCINSILNQTFKNIELILVNDGSTDNSGIICDDYSKSDDRVLVINKENGGIADAVNFGLEKATGDSYIFVDSDDYIEKEMIEEMIDIMIKTNSDIVQCGIKYINEKNESDFYIMYNNPKQIIGKENILKEYFWKDTIGNNLATKLIKAKAFEGIELEKGRQVIDVITVPQLLNNCGKYTIIENSFYNCIMTANSITRGELTEQKYDDKLYESIFLENFILKSCPDLKTYIFHRKAFNLTELYGRVYHSKNISDKKEKLSELKSLFDDNYYDFKTSKDLDLSNRKEIIKYRLFKISPKSFVVFMYDLGFIKETFK